MKRFINYIPLQLVVFLILGICIQQYWPIQDQNLIKLNFLVVVMLLVLMVVDRFRLRTSLLFMLWCSVVTVVVGINTYQLSRQLSWSDHFSNSHVFLENSPSVFVAEIHKKLRPTNRHDRYEARVVMLDEFEVTGRILLHVEKSTTTENFIQFDRILVSGKINPIGDSKNPGPFSYRKYLSHLQIYHQVFISPTDLKIVPNTNASLLRWVAELRAKIMKNLDTAGFTKSEQALVNAIVLGQREGLSAELITSFSNAGVIHILAVSGLHVGILYMFLLLLFKPLNLIHYGNKIATLLIVVCLWLFALLAGFSVSVIRSVTMFSLIALAMGLKRDFNVYHALITSMFLLLLVHPDYLFSVGFQMSYLAVFSIVWLQPKIAAILQPKRYFTRKIWQLLTVSLAAQVGVFPISLYYFHQFPSLFLVSNLIVIPLLSAFLILGILLIISSLVKFYPTVLIVFYQKMINFLDFFITQIGSFESFVLQEVHISMSQLLAIYIFLGSILSIVHKRSITRIQIALGAFLVLSLVYLHDTIQKQSIREWVFFNSYKSSLFAFRNGMDVEFYTNDSTAINVAIAKNYLGSIRLKSKIEFKEIPIVLPFEKEVLLVVDSLSIYQFQTDKPKAVIIRQSPDIHLEQLLKTLQPDFVIADGSNYNSDLSRWEATCLQMKTPFFATAKKGAQLLKIK